jgi:hypothetical protein
VLEIARDTHTVMGSQELCSPFDASTGTRILTPSSQSLLSSHEASVVAPKKRKRERGAMEDLLDEYFVVKVEFEFLRSANGKANRSSATPIYGL